MDGKYLCPHCEKELFRGKGILIKAVRKNGKTGEVTLVKDKSILEMEHDERFRFDDDDHLDFFCPHCNESLLASKETSNLQLIKFIDNAGTEQEMFFSRIKFSRCTYVFRKQEVKVKGENLYKDHLKRLLYRKYGMHNTQLTPR